VAVDAKTDGADIFIMARRDANHTHGIQEAINRAKVFHEIGADILFVEAPKYIYEMRLICSKLPNCKMANIVEGGLNPNLTLQEIAGLGYQIAAHPLKLLSASMLAMKTTLELMKDDLPRDKLLLYLVDLSENIVCDEYYKASEKYTSARRK